MAAIIGGIVVGIIFVVIVIVHSFENEYRKAKGLPRKYHGDITDRDFTTVQIHPYSRSKK